MTAFEGPEGVFAAGRDALSDVLRGGSEYVDKLCDPALLEWAADEVAWAQRYGIRLLGLGEADYPRRLAECEDAPLMLYCKGPADLNAPRAVAVVGTRKATWQGRETCRRLVENLAELDEKPLIVSGLALGIDGCAHEAALASGLPTVGVLPCGLDEIYPRQHREMARKILERGALVTDFPRGTAPVAFTFLRRNRIIAGMTDATLLAESFVRQEATLVADERTLPAAMGWAAPLTRVRRPSLLRPDDPPMRREALKLLESRTALSADELAALMRVDAREANILLLELELEGRVVADGSKFLLSL